MTFHNNEQPQGDDQPTTYFPPAPELEYVAYDQQQWQRGYEQQQWQEGYGQQPWPQGYEGYAEYDAAPPKRSNGVLVFLGVLVFTLAVFSGAAALYIFGPRTHDQTTAQQASDSEEQETSEPEVENPAEEFGQRLEALDRPQQAKLPPEAQPVNLAAKQNHPAGNLFNVYKSGPVSDEFAVETQYEYVSLYTEPPAGDHLLLVFDSGADDFVELHCQDYSSYVRCVAPGNRYVYIA